MHVCTFLLQLVSGARSRCVMDHGFFRLSTHVASDARKGGPEPKPKAMVQHRDSPLFPLKHRLSRRPNGARFSATESYFNHDLGHNFSPHARPGPGGRTPLQMAGVVLTAPLGHIAFPTSRRLWKSRKNGPINTLAPPPLRRAFVVVGTIIHNL